MSWRLINFIPESQGEGLKNCAAIHIWFLTLEFYSLLKNGIIILQKWTIFFCKSITLRLNFFQTPFSSKMNLPFRELSKMYNLSKNASYLSLGRTMPRVVRTEFIAYIFKRPINLIKLNFWENFLFWMISNTFLKVSFTDILFLNSFSKDFR